MFKITNLKLFSNLIPIKTSIFFLLLLICVNYCQNSYIKVDNNNNLGQDNPVTVVNPNNKEFIIFWNSFSTNNNNDIYAKRFNINGIPIGVDTLINASNLTLDQYSPKAAFLNALKIIVLWETKVNYEFKIQGVIIDSDFSKKSSEFDINTPDIMKNSMNPSLFTLSNERFIIIYKYKNLNNKFDIYATVYDSNQQLLKSNFKINIRETNSSDLNYSCTEFSDNRLIVVYSSVHESSSSIYI